VNGDQAFRYEGYTLDPDAGLLTCRYSLGRWNFTERIGFGPGGHWDSPAVADAARLVFLLAGVSYYKTAAPSLVGLGGTPITTTEYGFLRDFYIDGLAEFGYRNGLDLTGIEFLGHAAHTPMSPPPAPGARPAPVRYPPPAPRLDLPRGPLIPFGGGIDSIVTVESMRSAGDAALFIMSRPGDRFEAIERPAAVTGLPVVRAEREIDPQLLRPAGRSFRNGHVPVTGILSAIAVMAALLDGRGTVVMSNEWSASSATLESAGRPVNHQYSKSAAFESGFRQVLTEAFGGQVTYFSALRPFTELWVARKFACLTQYHATFRSCNRAFALDPARRLGHWCGRCDKCCFIDLILAPFLPAADLRRIFGGAEPLDDPALADRFRALLGTAPLGRPFECVGDVGECRAAASLAAARPDRAGTALLHALAAELPPVTPSNVQTLLRPVGGHAIPDAYATDDLLV
jgi:hypothetical protein